MRARLLANRRGKLHNDQWREVVVEPLVTVLVLMVPTIILLRSFLLTLFVGGLWMVGVGGLLVGGILLFFRARRYRRIRVHFGVFRAPDTLPPTWRFWKPVILMTPNGTILSFKHSLTSDKRFKANQEYLVYYLKSDDSKVFTLLSFAPTDHLDTSTWQPLTKGQ